MALIVDRTDDRSEPTTRDEGATLESDPQRRRIDVTDLHAAGIEEFVESSVDADDVSLEHRLDRTYLVIEE